MSILWYFLAVYFFSIPLSRWKIIATLNEADKAGLLTDGVWDIVGKDQAATLISLVPVVNTGSFFIIAYIDFKMWLSWKILKPKLNSIAKRVGYKGWDDYVEKTKNIPEQTKS